MDIAVRMQLVLITTVVAVAACAPGPEPTPTPPDEAVTDPAPARVSVSAEVDDDIVAVETTTPEIGDQGVMAHRVEVTWIGDARVTLDDARFTHHVTGDPEGDLVLAGRGCGAQWDMQRGELLQPCTMDLQIIELGPGETHGYPAVIHPEVGPLRLIPGTYIVEEVVGWRADGDVGQFTITLTYTVE